MGTNRSIYLVIRISLLIVLVSVAVLANRVSPVAAPSTTSTYVLGVSSPTDPLIIVLQNLTSSLTLLSSVSSLSLLAPNSILFIDGTWLQSVSSLNPALLSTVAATAINGVPSVVVRGNPAILRNSISGLPQFGAPSLPLLAEGVKIFNTLPDGARQAADYQVFAGFNMAVKAEFHWAEQELSEAIPSAALPALTASRISFSPTATASPTDPSWQFLIKITTDSGNYYAPAGRVISTFTIFRLQNSGSSDFKWFNFFANQTLIPGILLYGNEDFGNFQGEDSAWKIFGEQDSVSVNSQSNFVVSHGPTALVATSSTTVKYSVGVTAGSLGAVVTSNQTQRYVLRNTSVTDSISNYTAGWTHNIDPRTNAGASTFKIIPGWTDRALYSQGMDVSGTFASSFFTYRDDGTPRYTIRTLQFGARGG